MGKRKRCGDEMKNRNDSDRPSSSGNMPCTLGADSFSKENPANLVELGQKLPCSSSMGLKDTSAKLLNSQSSLVHPHTNMGRSVFLKRPRLYYGHHYSRRNHSKLTNASTSHSIGSSPFEEKLSFKLASHYKSDSAHKTENRVKALNRAERLRSRSSIRDAASPDMVEIACGICQKFIRRKPCLLGDIMSELEYAVVAVLVCGHVYHAECLEEQTRMEDTREPPCPLCLDVVSAVDA